MNYQRFAMLPELLSLQRPLSDPAEHDEMLFIIVHQVHELWFKAALHELDHARPLLMAGDEARAAATLRRVRSIMKVLVGQLDVLETMTPVEFESFRDRLETASGFQSAQFRELEFALGIKRASVLKAFPDPDEHRRLERRLHEPALWDAFLRFMVSRGCRVPERALTRDLTKPVTPDPRGAEGAGRGVPLGPGPGQPLRTTGGPGRRVPGVALQARQDGGAHHWQQTRDG